MIKSNAMWQWLNFLVEQDWYLEKTKKIITHNFQEGNKVICHLFKILSKCVATEDRVLAYILKQCVGALIHIVLKCMLELYTYKYKC